MVTIRQLSVTDVLADGYQMAVWGAPTGDTRRAALSTLAAYLGTEGNITESKLTMQTARMLGRTTAAEGEIEEIQIGDGLTLTAGYLTGDVESVNGETGEVVLEPEDITAEYLSSSTPIEVEALPYRTGATLSLRLARIALDDTGKPYVHDGFLPLVYQTSGTPTANSVPLYGTSGRLWVGTPVEDTDAATKGLVDGRLSAAQRSAINALTAGSTAADIVAALQAV